MVDKKLETGSTEQKSSSNHKFENSINSRNHSLSRRDFLKLGAVGTLAGASIAATKNITNGEPVLDLFLSDESLEKLDQIKEYRRKLKLESLPDEFVPAILNDSKWNNLPPIFAIEVTPELADSAKKIEEICKTIYGDNYGRLINKVHAESGWLANNASFDPLGRVFMLGENVRMDTLQLTKVTLHEAIGHASDPQLTLIKDQGKFRSIYPADMFVSVEHGKWRALSQVFNVDRQFFNHPHDSMYPKLQKNIGSTIGQYLVGEESWLPIFEGFGLKRVKDEISKIATNVGTDMEHLVYTKAICKEIGRKVLSLFYQDEVQFQFDLKKIYQREMEFSLKEIYAEMVKYAILDPLSIDENLEIIGGVEEVIATVSGAKPNLQSIRKFLLLNAGLDANYTESGNTLETISDQSVRLNPQTTQTNHPAAITDFSNLSIDEQYKLACNIITNKYPILKNTFAQQYDESFDPNMHMWKTVQVEWAIDTYFVENLNSKTLTQEEMSTLEKRVKILTDFCNSSYF